MPEKKKPRQGRAEVSCNQRGGCLQETLSLSAYRAQHLIAEHGIRPDLAVMVASFAFGGHGHG